MTELVFILPQAQACVKGNENQYAQRAQLTATSFHIYLPTSPLWSVKSEHSIRKVRIERKFELHLQIKKEIISC